MRRKTRILWKHWGIWVFKWGAVPVLIIVGTRLVWGLEAGHRLARTEGELRAKHLWLDEAQLRGTPVPKGQNAVTALLKVLGAAKLSKADMDLMTGRNRPGDFLTAVYTPAELVRSGAILARLHPL